jgi:hypothetical protein
MLCIISLQFPKIKRSQKIGSLERHIILPCLVVSIKRPESQQPVTPIVTISLLPGARIWYRCTPPKKKFQPKSPWRLLEIHSAASH